MPSAGRCARVTKWDQLPKADAIVLAVAHREYLAMQVETVTASLQSGGCVIDVKSVLSRGEIVSLGFAVWRLQVGNIATC